MSRWNEVFDEHPIRQTLSQVREFLNVDDETLSSSGSIERRRLLKVLDLLDDAISTLDSETAPIATLTGINHHLRQPPFWNQVQAYKTNANDTHLVNANANIDTQLPQIFLLLGLGKNKKVLKLNKSTEESFDRFAETIDSKSKTFETQIDSFSTDLITLSGKADTLSKSMEALETSHSDKITDWETKFDESQAKRLAAFNEFQTEREKAFKSWLTEFKTKSKKSSDSIETGYKKELSQFYDSFETDVETMRTDATTRHNQILELHGLVAGDGVVAGYVANAEAEKGQANFWRWVAIGFIVATAIWLGLTYSGDVTASSDVGSILARMARIVPLTAVFIYGAVYASKQSSFHRNNEKQTRWFALEVKAIDPFIAALEPEQQSELKAKLTERIFGQNANESNQNANYVDPNLLKVILEAMKDVVKK